MVSESRIVTLKMPIEMIEMLDEIARRKGVSRSELIREAVSKYLAGLARTYMRVEPKVVRLDS